ncbi:unnamed protein product [Calicophoron daubneyi]|uniref:Uncharacterized protein n=1 Tax=Calicophoron daubneyi TaxID=300641 RepID=A0AAV2TM13_CALDB
MLASNGAMPDVIPTLSSVGRAVSGRPGPASTSGNLSRPNPAEGQSSNTNTVHTYSSPLRSNQHLAHDPSTTATSSPKESRMYHSHRSNLHHHNSHGASHSQYPQHRDTFGHTSGVGSISIPTCVGSGHTGSMNRHYQYHHNLYASHYSHNSGYPFHPNANPSPVPTVRAQTPPHRLQQFMLRQWHLFETQYNRPSGRGPRSTPTQSNSIHVSPNTSVPIAPSPSSTPVPASSAQCGSTGATTGRRTPTTSSRSFASPLAVQSGCPAFTHSTAVTTNVLVSGSSSGKEEGKISRNVASSTSQPSLQRNFEIKTQAAATTRSKASSAVCPTPCNQDETSNFNNNAATVSAVVQNQSVSPAPNVPVSSDPNTSSTYRRSSTSAHSHRKVSSGEVSRSTKTNSASQIRSTTPDQPSIQPQQHSIVLKSTVDDCGDHSVQNTEFAPSDANRPLGNNQVESANNANDPTGSVGDVPTTPSDPHDLNLLDPFVIPPDSSVCVTNNPDESKILPDTGILINPVNDTAPIAVIAPQPNGVKQHDRADTPTASEQYWTPDPPASPSNGSTVVCPKSCAADIVVSVSSSLPSTFDSEIQSLRSSSVANIAQVPTNDSPELINVSRPRLESLNDVD